MEIDKSRQRESAQAGGRRAGSSFAWNSSMNLLDPVILSEAKNPGGGTKNLV
jgi:hypothetical protein